MWAGGRAGGQIDLQIHRPKHVRVVDATVCVWMCAWLHALRLAWLGVGPFLWHAIKMPQMATKAVIHNQETRRRAVAVAR